MAIVVDPVPGQAPRAVRFAVIGWAVAVGASGFETLVAVASRAATGDADLVTTFAQAMARVVVLATALWVALRLLEGRRWARVLLTVLLSGLGLALLLADPVAWLAGGGSRHEAVAGASVSDWLFGGSRVVHVAAVLTATVLMYLPSANAFFRRPGVAPGAGSGAGFGDQTDHGDRTGRGAERQA